MASSVKVYLQIEKHLIGVPGSGLQCGRASTLAEMWNILDNKKGLGVRHADSGAEQMWIYMKGRGRFEWGGVHWLLANSGEVELGLSDAYTHSDSAISLNELPLEGTCINIVLVDKLAAFLLFCNVPEFEKFTHRVVYHAEPEQTWDEDLFATWRLNYIFDVWVDTEGRYFDTGSPDFHALGCLDWSEDEDTETSVSTDAPSSLFVWLPRCLAVAQYPMRKT